MNELNALLAVSGILLGVVLGAQVKLLTDVADIKRRILDCKYCQKGTATKGE